MGGSWELLMTEGGSISARTEWMRDFLAREHFRFLRALSAMSGKGEVELPPGWTPRLDAPSTPLTRRMLLDFETFCAQCMECPPGDGSFAMCWRLRTGLPAMIFDSCAPEIEAFDLHVADDRIEILASHERGLLHGTHYLEWMFADRGGPFLPLGTISRTPAFTPRITNGVFIPAHETPETPGNFVLVQRQLENTGG